MSFAQQGQLELELRSPVDHHYMLVGEKQIGTQILWKRLADTDWEKHWFKLEPGEIEANAELLKSVVAQPEIFLTPHEFKGWRTIALLKALNCTFLDFDLKSGSPYKSPESLANAKLFELGELGFPRPNVIVFTGGGCHFYWLYSTKAPKAALPRWQALQSYLCDKLQADTKCLDAARVLRVIGTLHQKTQKIVTAEMLVDARFSFDYLCEFLPRERASSARVRDLDAARARKGAKTGEKPTGRGRLANGQSSIFERWYLVYRDLNVLIAHHFPNRQIEDGARDLFIFHLANALSWFTRADAIESEILAAASKFAPDWSEEKVRKKIQSVLKRAFEDEGEEVEEFGKFRRHGRYQYKRETLLADFAQFVTPEIIPKLRAILPNDVRRERRTEAERNRRYASGQRVPGRTRSNLVAQKEALSLLAQGATANAVANALGVTRRTIENWKANASQIAKTLSKGDLEAIADVSSEIDSQAHQEAVLRFVGSKQEQCRKLGEIRKQA